jgi:hypothetical protein
VRFNGRVNGTLRGPNGDPLPFTSVNLVPADDERDPRTGVADSSSVATDGNGQFEFTGRTPGRYLLGVGLLNGPNPAGLSYPRTYYPGTVDPAQAEPVVVEAGSSDKRHDFVVPYELHKGELEVTTEQSRPGRLKLCVVPLERAVRSWSSYDVQPDVPFRVPVVEGERYEVHAHLEYRGGHLESEHHELTATTGKTAVRLRPSVAQELHGVR